MTARVRGVIAAAERLARHEPVVVFSGGHDDRRRADEAHLLRVADPIGRGDDHLVARLVEREGEVEERVLHAARNDDLLGLRRPAAIALGRRADRLFQRRCAGDGGVVRRAAVDRLFGGLADGERRVEVGLADAECKNAMPLLAKLGRASGHGEGGAGCNGGKTRGESCRQGARHASAPKRAPLSPSPRTIVLSSCPQTT